CLQFAQQVVTIDNHRVHPKLSAGIAMYPDDGDDVDQLLRHADMAMYDVKHNGKYGFAFFNPRMAAESADRVRLEADLRQAIGEGEFDLWYQPKIDISTGELSGVEALIRWHHPTRGMIPPDLFIATAERVGMIKEIGEWVIATACAQLQQWRQSGLHLQMAVNVSSSHFASRDFVDFVQTNLERFGLQDGELEIEITESTSRDPEEHCRVCHQLRELGVRIAIDDFGTGYSSLSVLGKLEVDTLKIDRSFISGLPTDNASCLMVRAIVDLSLGLGYAIVAEGVETKEQLDFLTELRCPYVQGFYFSKPVLASDIPVLYANPGLTDAQHKFLPRCWFPTNVF
ncbi:MAG: GGDEF domain-containing phosphodiesterase, partial [Gammaproteobacteria bacterium]|nr:GGDEF domain-containing phosphodiesterase [Gammaproteobacteria bacterium]